MPTPSQLIAELDAALLRRGNSAVLRRYTAATGDPRPKTDVAVMASVRPLRAAELVGDLTQRDQMAVISPTAVVAGEWPLPVQVGDLLVLDGVEWNIEVPRPVSIGGTLVRINLLLRG